MSRWLSCTAAALCAAGCASSPIDAPLRVPPAITSQLVCSGAFVSKLPPETVFQEQVLALPGMGWLGAALSYEVHRDAGRVSARLLGGAPRDAVHLPGYGCVLLPEEGPAPAFPPKAAQPPAASPWPGLDAAGPVEPATAPLRAALDVAFADNPAPPFHRTRAVVVVHRDRIVAERYAPGVGIDTPMPSWSVAKSVTQALVGTLVADGALALDDGLPGWQDAGDPRRAVTVDMLLRQTSGLALGRRPSPYDVSTRMKYLEADPPAFASTAALEAPPGSRWTYADGHYTLLSRLLRDRLGGPEAVVQHARARLFAPLGMAQATLEFDATGTPLGDHAMLASARDYARFGLLYLHDGMAGDRRVLPADWVRAARTRTPGTGYGAGFFVNEDDGRVPGWGVPWGMPHAPRDTFFARGFMGQYVVVVPSRELVVVRLGPSQVEGDDVRGMDRVMGAVLAALPPPR